MNDPPRAIPLPRNQRPPGAQGSLQQHSPEVARVLTYALLSLTLLGSASVAATGVALKLPALGLVITLVGFFGLLFAIYNGKNSC